MSVSVWVPAAKSVDVVVAESRTPMVQGRGGWWTAEGVQLNGTPYRFAIDGGEPLADPRSASQPEGVFGPSLHVDHSRFPWTARSWHAPPLRAAVIYELHIGTFTPEGTFDAAIGALEHLVRLGISHVEIMPVAEFSGTRGWGYDGVFLNAPHHAYGGPDGLKRFVDACHTRGLAVILDVVYNHFGPSGNVMPRFGPYVTDRHRTPWGPSVNLDGAGSDEVRRFFIDNAVMWLRDYRIDGLRLDAVHALIDQAALPFLEELAQDARALSAHLRRPVALIAESDLNDPRLVRDPLAGGMGLDAHWCDDFHHAVHALLTGETSGYYADFGRMAQLARAFQSGYVYQGEYAPSRGRRHGRPAGLSGHQLVACIQNHDQIGNRARGERLSQLVSMPKLRLGAALLFVAPHVPMLFMGEEWAARSPFLYFAGFDDPALADGVRNGRRDEFAAFGWKPEDVPDPMAAETFQSSKLRWDELRDHAHADMLAWYRKLILVRRAEPDLTDGRFDRVQVRFDEEQRWITVRRGRVLMAANLSGDARHIDVDGTVPSVVAASSGDFRIGECSIDLGADSVVILR